MPINNPLANHITDIGKDILRCIRYSEDKGVTRPEIAEFFGKKRLNKWHEAQIKLLESEGFITITTRPNARLEHITEYLYNATDKE